MTTETLKPGASRPFLAALGEAVVTCVEFLARHSIPARCAAEADRLFALSDEELARLGLTRDRVIRARFPPLPLTAASVAIGAPSEPTNEQLRELGIRLDFKC